MFTLFFNRQDICKNQLVVLRQTFLRLKKNDLTFGVKRAVVCNQSCGALAGEDKVNNS